MKSSTDKKQRLLQASMELIEEQAFDKTPVAQIAARAGVAKGTFYLYFPAKAAVVPEMARILLDKQLMAVKKRETGSVDALLHALVEESFSLTKENRALITYLYSGFAYEHSFETWDAIYEPYHAWIADKLRAFQASGHVVEEEAESLASLAVGVIEHSAEAQYLSRVRRQSEEEAQAAVYRFVLRAWKGAV
ncbi:TetR family transcriptional regulator [Alkalicoccus urumqiensis]|uniref:TetR family transcriptional regulator n=1 Tax=Alkalicoccus urumqiensis TaxID=1548213 RepID=A0A2P6MHP3_ALKUR|nr:TetR family transcriptional regulator [Alkalicoccus urumqiensis]PRO65796.1 TetR family transcriptional regulator [Alkalicoccus urumqiensis]